MPHNQHEKVCLQGENRTFKLTPYIETHGDKKNYNWAPFMFQVKVEFRSLPILPDYHYSCYDKAGVWEEPCNFQPSCGLQRTSGLSLPSNVILLAWGKVPVVIGC